MFSSIETALEAFKAGRFVLVTDDESRENEGDLIMAAQFVDKIAINFLLQNARGMICVPLPGARLDALQLGPMTERNTDRHGTAYTADHRRCQKIWHHDRRRRIGSRAHCASAD